MTVKLKGKQKRKCAYGKKPDMQNLDLEKGHSCLRHYTCRSCGMIHVRKGQ